MFFNVAKNISNIINEVFFEGLYVHYALNLLYSSMFLALFNQSKEKQPNPCFPDTLRVATHPLL